MPFSQQFRGGNRFLKLDYDHKIPKGRTQFPEPIPHKKSFLHWKPNSGKSSKQNCKIGKEILKKNSFDYECSHFLFWLCTSDDINQSKPSQAQLKRKPIWKLLSQKERAKEAQKPQTGRWRMKVKTEGRRVRRKQKEPANSGWPTTPPLACGEPASLKFPHIPQECGYSLGPHYTTESGCRLHVLTSVYHHSEYNPPCLFYLNAH